MFSVYLNAWRVKDIRKKLFYVLLMLAVFRIGCAIPLPGIGNALTGGDRGMFALIAGGSYGSVFAMGIGPYITASIIMQLLTVAIPPLERLKKEGQEGTKKINQYTRIAAVALAFLQGAGEVYNLSSYGAFTHPNMFVYITALLTLVTGTMFVMWMSELLTEKAIGNGSSFIIFANILSGVPNGINVLYGYATGGDIWGWIKLALILVIFIAVIVFVIIVQDGERRIPVQYSKKMVGRQMHGGQSSFIPIKVNIAGVMSIIFAMSLLGLPQNIYNFWQNPTLYKITQYVSQTHPLGAVLYIFLIFCFTFFYTSFAMNPVEMAENMKKNGGFIPGIRPGKPTSDYIQRTIDRLSWIGAVFYSVIAMIPVLIQWIFGVPVGFGGTTLLIVVGVALELVKQLESQLLMRHYKGFLS